MFDIPIKQKQFGDNLNKLRLGSRDKQWNFGTEVDFSCPPPPLLASFLLLLLLVKLSVKWYRCDIGGKALTAQLTPYGW